MDNKINVFLIQFSDPLLGETLGLDLQVLDPSATVADLMDALDAFAREHLAECKGCDGCCKERAPLIAADIDRLASLLPPSPYPAHQVCQAFAELSVKRKVSDITLKRNENGACMQLVAKERCCRIWQQRAFVCRSHFCLPRSDKIEELRQDIVNAGINELTRLLLLEEANGAPPLTRRPLAKLLRPADYEENPQKGLRRYEDILLKETVSPALWEKLCQPLD